jgi:hypothetical protein
MKRIRLSPEQIINKLREADAMLASGKTVAQVCSAPLKVGQPVSLIFGKIAAGGGDGKEVLLSGGSAPARASSLRVVRA